MHPIQELSGSPLLCCSLQPQEVIVTGTDKLGQQGRHQGRLVRCQRSQVLPYLLHAGCNISLLFPLHMLAQTVIERLQPDRLEQAVIHAGSLAFIELLLTSIGRQAQDHTRPPAMVPLPCTVLSRQLESVHPGMLKSV